jgi:uncharacterized protein (DUF2062 family)
LDLVNISNGEVGMRVNLKKIIRMLKRHFCEVLRMKNDSHSIAFGVAVGTFISMLPFPGGHIPIAILTAFFVEKINKLILFASLAVWNPLTMAPIYYASYRISKMFFDINPITGFNSEILNQLFTFIKTMLIGNILIGILLALISYFVIRHVVSERQKKKSLKIRRRPEFISE